jgi:hypothetical protein
MGSPNITVSLFTMPAQWGHSGGRRSFTPHIDLGRTGRCVGRLSGGPRDEFVPRPARATFDAAHLGAVTVDLRDSDGSRFEMQVVDVLRDGVAQDAHALQLRERQVRGIRVGVP